MTSRDETEYFDGVGYVALMEEVTELRTILMVITTYADQMVDVNLRPAHMNHFMTKAYNKLGLGRRNAEEDQK